MPLTTTLNMAEKRISELEEILAETAKTEKEKKRLKKRDILKLWDSYRRCNIHVIGIPEGEERKEQKKY